MPIIKLLSATSRSLTCFLLLVAVDLAAAPRPPIPRFPELTLKSWKFDYPELVTAEGMGAHVATNLWLAESWSGYSLNMTAEGALLLTPAVRGYYSNLKETNGTIRLWFAPNWSSTSAGGSGPGDWATLFELGQTNTVTNPFGFALAIDPAGTNLVAAVNTATGTFNLVEYPLNWTTGVWHQIAFVYWTQGVALMVDDSAEQFAAAIPPWPTASTWNQSAFSLGSAFDASQSAQGQLDEIHTFGYALPTNYLAWTYQLYAPIAALGPLSDEEWGAQTSSVPAPCDPCPEGDTNSYPSYSGGWTTNAGLKFASNPAPYIVGRTNFVTVLDEASPFKAYQIFQATQILGSTLITTNIYWSLVTNGAIGVSNFTFRLPTSGVTNQSFYVAADAKDSDSDGFSDAYEQLISKTNPNQFNDSDNDGLGDNHFSLYFELKNATAGQGSSAKPQGHLIRGKGFRVWAESSSTYSTLRFYFEKMYRGLPLNIFRGTDDFPAPYEKQVAEYELPAPDGTFHKYLIKYDFRTFRLTVSNSTSQIADIVSWRDNMMDALGTNGPSSTIISNMTSNVVQNVTFTPAQFQPVSRYVWEGSIGNTSQELVGPSVHSPWWPLLKMVSKGTNVFYTCGYNEGRWNIQRFHTNNFQFVNTNFSWNGEIQLNFVYPVDMALDSAGTTLYVRFFDKSATNYFTNTFNADTCAPISTNTASWPSSPILTIPTNGSLAVATHPENSSIAAVYYKDSDQVVVYTNATGTFGTNFVIGVAGGYSNGPSILVPTNTGSFRQNVKLGGYYYDPDPNPDPTASRKNVAVLCFQSDGKLWVGDTITARMLRFDTSGLCDGWFMSIPHSYCAYVNPNDPQRVFDGYLEFRVDYSKPLRDGWVLTNYWGRYTTGNEAHRGPATQNGLFTPMTITNGASARTYAMVTVTNPNANLRRIVELTATGVRPTPVVDLNPLLELERDGSTYALLPQPSAVNGTNVTFYRNYITSWNGADPTYTQQTLGNVAYTDGVHPIYWSSFRTNGPTIYCFYPDKKEFEQAGTTYTGWHLGAVSNGSPGLWLWTNSPTGPLNGFGKFDTDAEHAGTVQAPLVVGTNIFYVYRGEYWQGGRQANQIMHYSTSGKFLGQFGTPLDAGTLCPPAGAGNIANYSAALVNGVIYLYTPDESCHGIHRWRIE